MIWAVATTSCTCSNATATRSSTTRIGLKRCSGTEATSFLIRWQRSRALPWVNEIHYDNDGEDVDEFVEIAGPSGLVLDGWQLVGYNGNGGRVYRTIDLAGTLEFRRWDRIRSRPLRGFRTVVPMGSLIAPDGHVVEF